MRDSFNNPLGKYCVYGIIKRHHCGSQCKISEIENFSFFRSNGQNLWDKGNWTGCFRRYTNGKW